MLASERQNPRPRPPALLRRSTSKGGLLSFDGVPPPPYASEFPSLKEPMEGDVSDPLAATAKMMGIELDTEVDMSCVTEEVVSKKSKAELADLFLQAERIIKAREQELNVAANLGKTLLETNEALKLRHDALLARLPAMQSQLASNAKKTHSSAATPDDDTLSQSATLSRIHSRTNSVISIVQSSPAHSRSNSILGASPSPRPRDVHRISASPSTLLALSETNAELITELTHLHSTTNAAQVEGAQRLRKLEREIGGLKAELEASQRTNAELEEKVKEKVDEERKREREERLRRLRHGGPKEDDSASEEPIWDFAPQGSGMEKWDGLPITQHSKHATMTIPSESESEHSDTDGRNADASSAASSRPASQCTTSRGEYAIIAQLYRKVVELQEANAELTARNRVTNKQLARAEHEALEIKKLYEAIDEELVADQSEQDHLSVDTIRASSAGTRSSVSKSTTWSLRIRGDPFIDNKRSAQKSYGSLGSRVLHHGARQGKNRAPLTDELFSPPKSTTPSNRGGTPPSVILFPSSPSSKTKLKPKLKGKGQPQSAAMRFLSPVSTGTLRRSVSNTSGRSVSSRNSAASSSLSVIVGRYGPPKRGRRSLGSELGSEFGDDWEGGVHSEHDSLFDDGSVRALSEGEEEMGSYGDTEEEDPAVAALHDALTPPLAGRLREHDEHILPLGSLQSSPGNAFHLISHAVASRPARWLGADNRRMLGIGPRLSYVPPGEDPWETTCYPEIEPNAEVDGGRASVRLRRSNRAIERMVSMSRSRSPSPATTPPASQFQALKHSQSRGLITRIKRTSADVFLELWIVLQFVVVICIFLYTMTKRGPRDVLGVSSRRT